MPYNISRDESLKHHLLIEFIENNGNNSPKSTGYPYLTTGHVTII